MLGRGGYRDRLERSTSGQGPGMRSQEGENELPYALRDFPATPVEVSSPTVGDICEQYGLEPRDTLAVHDAYRLALKRFAPFNTWVAASILKDLRMEVVLPCGWNYDADLPLAAGVFLASEGERVRHPVRSLFSSAMIAHEARRRTLQNASARPRLPTCEADDGAAFHD